MDDTVRCDGPRTLFIGGSGRSGTSVTRRLIGLHPDAVSLSFEYRFLVDPDGIVDFYRSYEATWTPYLADRRLARLERLLRRVASSGPAERIMEKVLGNVDPRGRWLRSPPYASWELNRHLPNFSTHVEVLLEELTSFTFEGTWVGAEAPGWRRRMRHGPPRSRRELAEILGGFVGNVLGDLLAAQGRTLYVEDNTWNILLARELRELVPTSKILHVYRDPRDVVASFREQTWAPADADRAARWYADILDRWWHVRSELPDPEVLEISLEDLVAEPRQTAERISAFVGLTFEERMLGLSLDKAHIGRWHRDLSAAEQERIEEILRPHVRRLGYA